MTSRPRLPELYAYFVELPEAERAAWLEALAADEPELAREVVELAAADDRFGSRLDPPAFDRLTPEADAGSPATPTRIGDYRILREIGRGGMGRVHLAEQEGAEFRRRVALKILDRPAPSGDDLRRFRDEVRILAGLEHPGIARFLDGGRSPEGVWYLAVEYVEGVDLAEHARRRALPLEARLRLFLGVLEAVAFAHGQGVVHRDLKPANILVGTDGRTRLLDFGLAKLVDPDTGAATDVTRTESRALTPAYASPEQFRGEAATVASDVYSLGVVLYELVAGARPFGEAATSRSELERAVLGAEPDPPSVAARARAGTATGSGSGGGGRPRLRLGRELDAICLRALRKAPAERYPGVAAFAADLERFLAGRPVEALRGDFRHRLSRALRRRRGLVAAVVLALAAGLALRSGPSDTSRAPRATALAPPAGVPVEELERRFAAAPASLDAGAELAWALLRASRPREAWVVVGRLRQLPGGGDDPVVDLVEAAAATGLDEPQRALALLTRGLARARAERRDELFARFFAGRARSLSDLGRREEARADLDAARREAARAGDHALLARILNDLAIEELQRGELGAGELRLEQALAAARTADDRIRQGSILHNLGGVARLRARPDRAEAHLRAAGAIFHERSSPRRLATSQGDLSVALDELARPAEARALREEAIAGLRAAGDDTALAYILWYRAAAEIDRAALAGVETAAREIEAAGRASGNRTDLALAEHLRGRAAAVRGESLAAREELAAAARMLEESGEGDLVAEAGLELAALELESGRPAEVARLAEAASAAFRTDPGNRVVLRAETLLARAELARGRAEDARQRLAALEGLVERAAVRERIDFLRARAGGASGGDRGEAARRDLEAALALARSSERRLDELVLRLELAAIAFGSGGVAAARAEAAAVAGEAEAKGLVRIAVEARTRLARW